MARLTEAKVTDAGDLDVLLRGWRISLRAQNKAPRTIDAYTDAAEQFIAFLRRAGMPAEAARMRREHVGAYLADLGTHASASTVAGHSRRLQQFFRWLVEEGEVAARPFTNMRLPAIPEAPVAVLDDYQLRRLLKACEGREFTDRCDAAVIRMFIDTRMRLAEIAGLRLGMSTSTTRWPTSPARAADPYAAQGGLARRRGPDRRRALRTTSPRRGGHPASRETPKRCVTSRRLPKSALPRRSC